MSKKIEEDDYDRFPELSNEYKKPISEKVGTFVMNRFRRAGEILENAFEQEDTNRQDKEEKDMQNNDNDSEELEGIDFQKNVGSPTRPSFFNKLLTSIARWFEKVKDSILDSFENSTKKDENLKGNREGESYFREEWDFVRKNDEMANNTIKGSDKILEELDEMEPYNPNNINTRKNKGAVLYEEDPDYIKMTHEEIKKRDEELQNIKPYFVSNVSHHPDGKKKQPGGSQGQSKESANSSGIGKV